MTSFRLGGGAAKTARADIPSERVPPTAPDRNRELDAWQRLDWRLLLPQARPDVILIGEQVATSTVLALQDAGWTAIRRNQATGSTPGVPVAFLRNPSMSELHDAVDRSVPKGCVVVHVTATPPAGPLTVYLASRRCRHAGLQVGRAYLALPSLENSSTLLPLDHNGASRLALARMRRSREVWRVLRALVAACLFSVGLLPAIGRDFVLVTRVRRTGR